MEHYKQMEIKCHDKYFTLLKSAKAHGGVSSSADSISYSRNEVSFVSEPFSEVAIMCAFKSTPKFYAILYIKTLSIDLIIKCIKSLYLEKR